MDIYIFSLIDLTILTESRRVGVKAHVNNSSSQFQRPVPFHLDVKRMNHIHDDIPVTTGNQSFFLNF